MKAAVPVSQELLHPFQKHFICKAAKDLGKALSKHSWSTSHIGCWNLILFSPWMRMSAQGCRSAVRPFAFFQMQPPRTLSLLHLRSLAAFHYPLQPCPLLGNNCQDHFIINAKPWLTCIRAPFMYCLHWAELHAPTGELYYILPLLFRHGRCYCT